MLKKEAIQLIAKLTKTKPEELEAAIKDEKEVDLTIDEKLTVLSEDEITTLKNNEYKSGKEKGVEMAVKDTKEKLGLDFSGKTIDGLIEAASKKALADAKIEPEKKVQELQEKLAAVQKNYGELESKFKAKETEVETVLTKAEVYKHIPAIEGWEPDDVLALMQAKGYEFKKVEGKTIATLNGKEVTDKLSNTIPVKDVVTEFMKEKKLIVEQQQQHGRGAGDHKPTGPYLKASDIKKEFEAAGKSLIGQEFSEAVSKAAAANKEFVMDL